jgi:hypothetical protein
MKTLRFSGLVCVALAMFVLPAAAQTPDGVTPANEGICDPLADATPGLQGLCVAMCEAQACEAELDTNTGKVVYNPSCSPASDQLFRNYNKIVKRNVEKAAAEDRVDPPMPCVKVACPCWTEIELDDIAERPGASCYGGKPDDTFSGIFGASADGGGGEHAYVTDDSNMGLVCTSLERTPYTNRPARSIGKEAFASCTESIRVETDSRKMTCY